MKLNTFFSKLVPKENKFYPILRKMSDNIFACSELLIGLTRTDDKDVREDFRRHIKALETKGDHMLITLFDELNNTFITPFDREDINALGEKLDDVLDGMHSAAKRIAMYQPDNLPPQSVQLAMLLKKGCELIQTAVGELDTMKKSPKKVREICSQLHTLENQADDLYEHFITDIFKNEKDGINLIKLKEIMQELERTTDKADDVGKIIKAIIVKYT
jgi:predicted phosphate transport protein (TIGR00153 family)